MVRFFEDVKGYRAKRAYGSNGESMGMHKDVDVAVWPDPYCSPIRIQVKARKALPQWTKVPEGEVDIVAFREDRGEWYILLPLTDYADLI